MKKILVVLIFLVSLNTVIAIPQLPHQFYGTVSYNNTSISDRNIISAKINDIEYAGTYTFNGKYGYKPLFYIPADDIETIEKEGGTNKDKIDFYINGIKVASYTFESGATTELNLVSQSDLQSCGNEVCETYESSLNCPEDCGEIVKSEISVENNICFIKVKNKNRVKIECAPDDITKIIKAKIKKQKSGNKGYIIVSNLELPGKTKTVYLDKIAGYGSVCIKDEDIEDIGEITLNCNGISEFIVTCNGNSYNGYICTDLNDVYGVSGLKHSGVIEYEAQPEQPPETDGQGGGECEPSWVCSDWSDCEDGIQRRTCEDKRDCDKPYNPKTIRACEDIITIPPPLQEEKNVTTTPTQPTETPSQEKVVTLPVIKGEKHRNWLIIIFVIIAVSGIFSFAVYEKPKKSLKELELYIINSLNRGYTEEDIKNRLRSVGWPEKTINKFFKK